MVSFPSPKFTLIIVLLSCLMMSNDMVHSIIFCGLNDKGIEACLSAVRGSHPPPPTHAYCGYVKAADQKCFCQYRHSYLIHAFKINVAQVRKLPGMCGVKLTVTCWVWSDILWISNLKSIVLFLFFYDWSYCCHLCELIVKIFTLLEFEQFVP
jgi:Probable lipid transfer